MDDLLFLSRYAKIICFTQKIIVPNTGNNTLKEGTKKMYVG